MHLMVRSWMLFHPLRFCQQTVRALPNFDLFGRILHHDTTALRMHGRVRKGVRSLLRHLCVIVRPHGHPIRDRNLLLLQGHLVNRTYFARTCTRSLHARTTRQCQTKNRKQNGSQSFHRRLKSCRTKTAGSSLESKMGIRFAVTQLPVAYLEASPPCLPMIS